jgi:hypothetical protein
MSCFRTGNGARRAIHGMRLAAVALCTILRTSCTRCAQWNSHCSRFGSFGQIRTTPDLGGDRLRRRAYRPIRANSGSPASAIITRLHESEQWQSPTTQSEVDVCTAQAVLYSMDVKRPPSRQPAAPRPAPGKLDARQEREAAALRANLRKRKDQARAREAPKQA